jgi:hypothetical protein
VWVCISSKSLVPCVLDISRTGCEDSAACDTFACMHALTMIALRVVFAGTCCFACCRIACCALFAKDLPLLHVHFKWLPCTPLAAALFILTMHLRSTLFAQQVLGYLHLVIM